MSRLENADLLELLNEAVSNIHGEISEYEVADELEEEDNSIPADTTVRNFSYTVLDDKIYSVRTPVCPRWRYRQPPRTV